MNRFSIISEWAHGCAWVRESVLSSDGTALVTLHADGVAVWDLPSGRPLARSVREDNLGYVSVEGMAVDFARQRLAGWNSPDVPGERFLRLFDLRTGQSIRSRKVEEPIRAAAFDPSGRFLVTGEMKGRRDPVRLWSADTLQEVRAFEGHPGLDVDRLAISPDGALLATASFYREYQRLDDLYVWDLRAMRLKCRLTAPGGNFRGLYWSSDGARLIASLYDRAAVWDVDGFTRRDIDDRVLSMSAGNDYAAFLGKGDLLSIWNLKEMQLVSEARQRREDSISTVAVSPDGTMLLTRVKQDGTLWDTTSGLPLLQLQATLPRAFGPHSDFFLAERGEALALIQCPTAEERTHLLAEARRVEDERERHLAEERRRAEELRIQKLAEAKLQEEETRRAEEERRRAEELRMAEAKLREQERLRALEERQKRLQEARKNQAQCVMCGRPLGLFARVTGQDRHRGCSSFSI